MNGDLGIIYNKLTAMEEKQDKRHEDNLKTFGKLPCKLHAFIITTLLSIFTGGFVISIIVFMVRKAMAG